ncbi:MAG: amidohydrolase family protein [Planctomycetes bacterium]|nr:amidohydrolase family protein [Planctomycetota bacterium]
MKLLSLTSALCLTAVLSAQDLTPKAPPQAGPIVIENAILHTIDAGVIANGTLWFEGGRIRGVGPVASELGIPPGAERVDGRGLHVYPGLIGANTRIGLEEIEAVRATRDFDEVGDATPEARAAVAVNPDSTVIPVTRANGVLSVGVIPSGGLVPGRAAVMQLAGWTWEEMAVDADCGIVVEWPSLSSRRGRDDEERVARALEQRATIDAAFRDARAYLEARSHDPALATDVRALALAPALRGEEPVLVRADNVEQIQSAVTWAVGLGLRVVILGGEDALLCRDLLRMHDVGIIVTGTHRLPKRRDAAVDEPFRLPAELDAAGLRWCLASNSPFYNERNLPYHAATAVAYGLDHDAALRAITLSAAELLGVADELGSLSVGKRATLLLTDGDPLEFTTEIRRAFVEGRAIDLGSKHTRLAEKYREKYRQLGIERK